MDGTRAETRSALEYLSGLGRIVCGSGLCPAGRWSCCDRAFCEGTQRGLSAVGLEGVAEFDEDSEVPYLGEQGCRVPSHLRPTCSIYVCGILDRGPEAIRDGLVGTPWMNSFNIDLTEQATELVESDPFTTRLFEEFGRVKVYRDVEAE